MLCLFGYAELFNGKGSIISVFVKVHDANIIKLKFTCTNTCAFSSKRLFFCKI